MVQIKHSIAFVLAAAAIAPIVAHPIPEGGHEQETLVEAHPQHRQHFMSEHDHENGVGSFSVHHRIHHRHHDFQKHQYPGQHRSKVKELSSDVKAPPLSPREYVEEFEVRGNVDFPSLENEKKALERQQRTVKHERLSLESQDKSLNARKHLMEGEDKKLSAREHKGKGKGKGKGAKHMGKGKGKGKGSGKRTLKDKDSAKKDDVLEHHDKEPAKNGMAIEHSDKVLAKDDKLSVAAREYDDMFERDLESVEFDVRDFDALYLD